ncbi:MAG TPA: hypothetical protein VLV86_21480 [Vicinamibacterales bacterium]|nr:hypothetical protein [Vicinamibacterales bacterium]
MDSTELHAKAVLASAPITSHAVVAPSLPRTANGNSDREAARRLRGLVDYVYDVIVGGRAE